MKIIRKEVRVSKHGGDNIPIQYYEILSIIPLDHHRRRPRLGFRIFAQ